MDELFEDTHYSKRGNAVVAQALARELPPLIQPTCEPTLSPPPQPLPRTAGERSSARRVDLARRESILANRRPTEARTASHMGGYRCQHVLLTGVTIRLGP